MGSEWNQPRRSPMDTGGSGKSNGKTKALAIALLVVPGGVLIAVATFIANGYGVFG